MSYKSLYFPKLTRRKFYGVRNNYRDYRQEIRIDCQGRCVYCDAHENDLGGSEYMTIDHFKPKDKYRHLECEPTNLLWSCHKCNIFKDNIWPAIGTPGTVAGKKGFIDPFTENLRDYFDISPDGKLIALKHPADFIIKTLKLNRTGAKKIRERRNKRYESMQQSEMFLLKSIADMKAMLANMSLPQDFRSRLLQHKQDLEQQYILLKQNSEPDFNLY